MVIFMVILEILCKRCEKCRGLLNLPLPKQFSDMLDSESFSESIIYALPSGL